LPSFSQVFLKMSKGQFSGGRHVFVGNIPFDATEQQLIDFFSKAGEVVSFRVVHDQETGKPKGHGFCEYKDRDTAQSAIRNLKNVDFYGRILRVTSTDEDRFTDHDSSQTSNQQRAPPSNPGQEVVNKLIRSMSREQLIEILVEMKAFINKDPEGAKRLLVESPALAQALIQMQILFNMVRSQDYNALNNQQQQPAFRPAGPQHMAPSAVIHQPMQAMPPIIVQPQQPIQMQPMVQMLPQPVQILPPQQPPALPATIPAHQMELVQKVMKMGEAEIAKLDPKVQAQVRQLKQRMGLR